MYIILDTACWIRSIAKQVPGNISTLNIVLFVDFCRMPVAVLLFDLHTAAPACKVIVKVKVKVIVVRRSVSR